MNEATSRLSELDNYRENGIPLLDHGHVRLLDWMGSDLSIVRRARQSYNAEWRTGQDSGKDVKLIQRLMDGGHNTPFESPIAEFEVKAPIFVVRQWHRHRTQSYNEVSARYTELPEEYYVPDAKQITTQSTDNKQMRTTEQNPAAGVIREVMTQHNKDAFRLYKGMLAQGCPRELARSVLPMGTYTRMSATANLHNWMRFLSERLHPHAQYEIRVYAVAILRILSVLYPHAMRSFRDKYEDQLSEKS